MDLLRPLHRRPLLASVAIVALVATAAVQAPAATPDAQAATAPAPAYSCGDVDLPVFDDEAWEDCLRP